MQYANIISGVEGKKEILHKKAALKHTKACTVLILLLFTMDKNKAIFWQLIHVKLEKRIIF